MKLKKFRVYKLRNSEILSVDASMPLHGFTGRINGKVSGLIWNEDGSIETFTPGAGKQFEVVKRVSGLYGYFLHRLFK